MTSSRNKKPTAVYVRQRYDYCSKTGVLRYKIKAGHCLPGTRAGTTWEDGRRHVCINYKKYRASPIIWLWVTGKWPKAEIDHKNLDCGDDSWTNLREATRFQNACNRNPKKKSKHGYRGIIQQSKKKGRKTFRYSAQIMVLGKHITKGRFDTALEAAALYDSLAKKYHGAFARLNFP